MEEIRCWQPVKDVLHAIAGLDDVPLASGMAVGGHVTRRLERPVSNLRVPDDDDGVRHVRRVPVVSCNLEVDRAKLDERSYPRALDLAQRVVDVWQANETKLDRMARACCQFD